MRRFLPGYAKKFCVKARYSDDLLRPIAKGIDLDRILCIRTERALRNDFTVAHNGKLYQILDNIRAKKVMIEERVDGSMIIRYKKAALKFKEIKARPKKEEHKKTYKFKLKRVYVPPLANHPWKIEGRAHYQQHQQREKVVPKEEGLLLTVT